MKVLTFRRFSRGSLTICGELLRWLVTRAIRLSIWGIGPRMTLWSLYCVFGDVWSKSCPITVLADGTRCMVPYEGGVETKTWELVCSRLAECSDACEAYETAAGLGHRSEPFPVDSSTTCRVWIKTTSQFPWLKGNVVQCAERDPNRL
jgi:hypothetical protein